MQNYHLIVYLTTKNCQLYSIRMIGNTPAVNNQYYTFDVTEDSKKYDVLDQVNQIMLNPTGATGLSE